MHVQRKEQQMRTTDLLMAIALMASPMVAWGQPQATVEGATLSSKV
jgi:hypothetical protein